MQLLRIGWRFLVFIAVALFCGFFLVLSASYLYLGPTLPPAKQITKVQLQTPLRIYTADHKLIAKFGSKRRRPLTYKQFPPDFVHAILAAEDARFFEHGAVDFRGLARAVYELVRYQSIRSGGSTITMQVARNYFLTLNQTFLRKFNEIVLSVQIEHLLTKEQILTLYLNKIYLGKHAYGAASAAQVYYGKPLSQLNLAQMAMIAGLPQAPATHNPVDAPATALVRRNWILGRMLLLGFIDEAQYQLAAAQPVTARYHGSDPQLEASYAAELARQQVIQLMGESAYSRGINIYTTLQSKRQRAAVKAVQQGLQAYDMRHGWRGAIDHIDVSKLPQLPTVSKETKEIPVSAASRQWAKALDDYSNVARLLPAVVAQVDHKSALVVLQDAREIRLNWDALSWANKFINTNYRGHSPDEASDVISVGDIVYVLPTEKSQGDTQWRLAQIPKLQGAIISLDPYTGAIQAMQGGFDFQLSHFNRATQARRQPGSSFKPFVYASALEYGMTPATLLNDAPLVFTDENHETTWRPAGYTSKFYGPVRLRFALYESLNLASVRLMQRVGIDNAFKTLNRFHLPTGHFPHNLSIVLGSASLTPMQVATAYSTFANGGYHIRPWLIKRITNTRGETIWQAPNIILCDRHIDNEGKATLPADSQCPPAESLPKVSVAIDSGGQMAPLTPQKDPTAVAPQYRYRVMNNQVIWLMNTILQDVIDKGTGRRAQSLGYDELAGKTGTTDGPTDAWFAGYSPDLVAVVWTGFDQPDNIGYYEQGAVTALPIWITYMRGALPTHPHHHFKEPAGIRAVLINKETGKRAHPGDANTMFEYFRADNIPPFGDSTSKQQGVGPKGLF